MTSTATWQVDIMFVNKFYSNFAGRHTLLRTAT